MTGREVADASGVSGRAIRKKTKEALLRGENSIEVGGVTYSARMVHGIGGRGSVYEYDVLTNEDVDDTDVADMDGGEKCIIGRLSKKKQAKLDVQIKIMKEYELFKKHGGTVKEFLVVAGKDYPDIKLSEPTFFRWLERYKKGGTKALASRQGENRKGKTKLAPWMQQFCIEQFRAFGTGEFNFMQLWEDLHKEAHRMGLLDFYAWKAGKVKNLCSYAVPKNFLNTYYAERLLEYSLITVGEDKTKSRMQPAQGSRKEQFSAKNQCWEIDSSPLDMIIVVDGKQARPDIISIRDVYTGRCVMSLTDNSNALAIVRLLWKALKRFGKPDMIKGDNGRDYLSKQFQWLLDGLGIRYDRAIAYSGDQKGNVERHFRTVQHSYIQAAIGYIGANVGHRNMIEARTAKKDRKAKGTQGQTLSTQTPHDLLPTWEEAEARLEEAVILWEIDTKRVKSDESCMERWNNCLRTPEAVAHEEFLIYAGGQKARTLSKQGISFDGRTYKGPVVDQYRNIYKEVLVSENIDNIQELFVFSPHGEFLGVAFDEATKPMIAEEFHDAVRTFNREMRAARKVLHDSQLSVHARANVFEELAAAQAAQKRMLRQQEPRAKNFDLSEKLDRHRSANVAKVAAKKTEEKAMSYAQKLKELKHA